jgi:hypothetical protein
VLTAKGKQQCRTLSAAFPYHKEVDIVFASPLRRTIQTASLSFGPTLAREDVPFVLLPALQEVSDMGSDTGLADTGDELKQMLPELFANDKVDFDLEKIDALAVEKGWNSNVSRLTWGLGGGPLLTKAFSSKATGRTRKRPSRNERQIFGTGCFSVLRHRSVRRYLDPQAALTGAFLGHFGNPRRDCALPDGGLGRGRSDDWHGLQELCVASMYRLIDT